MYISIKEAAKLTGVLPSVVWRWAKDGKIPSERQGKHLLVDVTGWKKQREFRAQLVGQRFGKLLVIKEAEQTKARKTRWLCKCDCGAEAIVLGSLLTTGKRVSCGCERSIIGSLYQCWADILQRCYNPNTKSYKHYGGKGITVCSEWRDSFSIFETWAKSNGYEIGLTIDRIDSTSGYNPSNCRWIPLRENQMRGLEQAWKRKKLSADDIAYIQANPQIPAKLLAKQFGFKSVESIYVLRRKSK